MNSGDQATARYSGTRGPLFGLALKTSVLTLLTLGIYRFWAKTRIRKFIWSSISIGGDRLEYTGTGLEKFLGFLVAVVVLAVYLGLVQLVLFFFGLHFVIAPETDAEILMQLAVFYISFFALLPLILFAGYRARRYIMARTRLRGIRFGMDAAAWGYVWRALCHYLLTLVSLGILLPRQTFWLEKYKTDRTHFGDARFVQGGKWTALYPAMKHIGIGIGLIVCGLAASGYVAYIAPPGTNPTDSGAFIATIFVSGFGYFWAIIGYIYYGVHSFRYLTGQKAVGNAIRLVAEPRTGRVIRIYLLGSLAVLALAAAIFGVATGITAATIGVFVGNGAAPGPLGFVVVAVLYLLALAMFGALGLVFITQPILAHFVETTTVINIAAIDNIGQRAADKGADAEGFADALDIGAAI